MIVLLAGLVVAAANAPGGLVPCLANLSNTSEFVKLTDEQVGKDRKFLDAAVDRFCAEEVTPLWKTAHVRARAQLGVGPEGPLVSGEQEIAEREIRLLVTEAWETAKLTRVDPPPLSDEKMSKIALAWLLSDENSQQVESITKGPVECVAKGLARKQLTPKGPIISNELGGACGYDVARHKVASLVHTQFANTKPEFAMRTADVFLQQLTFWAALAAGNGNR